MSSVNWQKIKSVSQGKGLIAHNDKEKRKQRNHQNPDIDKNKIDLNLEFQGRDYDAKCKAYDERVAYCKSNMKRVRSDAVTLIGLNIKLPEGLMQKDYQTQCKWMKRTYEVVRDFVGEENVVSATADFDEVHEYFDPETKTFVMSRPEVDVKFVPEIKGKLNAKEFQTRANMVKLNNEVEQMTQKEFGCKFQTGKGAKKKSTDILKNESARALDKQIETQKKTLEEIDDQTKDFLEIIGSITGKEYKEDDVDIPTVINDLQKWSQDEIETHRRVIALESNLNARISDLKACIDKFDRYDEQKRIKLKNALSKEVLASERDKQSHLNVVDRMVNFGNRLDEYQKGDDEYQK